MKDGPLREGMLLVAGLGLLAVPLVMVTGQPKPARSQLVSAEASPDAWAVDVEVRSAHPFQWMELRSGQAVIGRIEGPASEGEFACELAKEGELIVVAASYPVETPETALQVQFWAGSFPEIAHTFWGKGELVEELTIKFDE